MDNVVNLHDSSLRHLVDDIKDALDGLSGNTINATMRVTGRDYRRPCAALVKSRSQQLRLDSHRHFASPVRGHVARKVD